MKKFKAKIKNGKNINIILVDGIANNLISVSYSKTPYITTYNLATSEFTKNHFIITNDANV